MRASCLQWNGLLNFCLEEKNQDPAREDHGKAKAIPFLIPGTVCSQTEKRIFLVSLVFVYLYLYLFIILLRLLLNGLLH